MSSLRTQTVSSEDFDKQVQNYPNAVVTQDYVYQYLVVGVRKYRALLQTRGDL